jgi:hypothetical protein
LLVQGFSTVFGTWQGLDVLGFRWVHHGRQQAPRLGQPILWRGVQFAHAREILFFLPPFFLDSLFSSGFSTEAPPSMHGVLAVVSRSLSVAQSTATQLVPRRDHGQV